MGIPKYYCWKCKQFKNMLQVKPKSKFTGLCTLWWIECKYCHEEVYKTKDILLDLITEKVESEDK